MATDYLSGRMAEERAEAIRTVRPRQWAAMVTRHPVVSAFVIFFVVWGGFSASGLVVHPRHGAGRYEHQFVEMLMQLGACALLAALIVALGLWRAVGFTPVRSWRQLHLLWLPVAVLILGCTRLLATGVTFDLRWIGITVPYDFLVGFFEEALLRGLVLFLLLYAWRSRPHGVLWAVLVSSALFGLSHSTNVFWGKPLSDMFLLIVAWAPMIGIGLAALALRTNTIWLGVIWHALWDLTDEAFAGPTETTNHTLQVVVYSLMVTCFVALLIYGLILLRRRTDKHQPTVMARAEPTG